MRSRRLRIVVPVALAAALAAFALVGALARSGDPAFTGKPPAATIDEGAMSSEEATRQASPGVAGAADGKATESGDLGSGETYAALPPAAAPATHYLIRNGSLTLTVQRHELRQAMQRIGAITLGMGGYVLSSYVGSDTPWVGPVEPLDYDPTDPAARAQDDLAPGSPPADTADDSRDVVQYGTITVRVPEARFEAAIERFAKLGEVVDMTTSADDVSDQMVDLRARLRHQRAVEKRLLSFLDKTTTIRETLAVQDRIDQTQLTIEQLTAEIARLSEVTSYGTITVALRERGVPRPGAIDESDTFWGAFTNSLGLIADGAKASAVALGAALPFLVLGAAFAVVVWRVRRALARRRPPQAPAAPAAPATQG